MITDEKLEQLRRDATTARNTPMVLACGLALRGDQAARQSIEDALAGRYPATYFITTTTARYDTLTGYMMRASIYAPSSTCGDEITVVFSATPDQVQDLTGLGFTVTEGA